MRSDACVAATSGRTAMLPNSSVARPFVALFCGVSATPPRMPSANTPSAKVYSENFSQTEKFSLVLK